MRTAEQPNVSHVPSQNAPFFEENGAPVAESPSTFAKAPYCASKRLAAPYGVVLLQFPESREVRKCIPDRIRALKLDDSDIWAMHFSSTKIDGSAL